MAGSSLTELPSSSGDAQLMPIIIFIRFNKMQVRPYWSKMDTLFSFCNKQWLLVLIAPRSLGWPLRSQLILTYLGESILLYFVHFLLVDHVLSSYFTFILFLMFPSTPTHLLAGYFSFSFIRFRPRARAATKSTLK